MTSPQLCVICGIRVATSRDHLPPAGIFPKPRPSDLVTVPCCNICNNIASAFDERFRVFLSLDVAFTHPDQIIFLNQNVLPTLNHNKLLNRKIFEKAERVFLYTPSGLSLGSAIAINWDIEAYDRVVERMIRGFHWHHTGVILGDKALVKVKYLNRISKALATTFDPFPVWSLGNGQLLYKLIYHETHPYQSAWVFQFFDRKWAGGYVSPINGTSRKCD